MLDISNSYLRVNTDMIQLADLVTQMRSRRCQEVFLSRGVGGLVLRRCYPFSVLGPL